VKNNIGLYLKSEKNWNLYMGLVVASLNNRKLEYLKPEKKEAILLQHIDEEYLKYDGNWICWDYIFSSNGQNYNFKNFSYNILNLDEKENPAEIEYFCNRLVRNLVSI
jgi:hypothetical protein